MGTILFSYVLQLFSLVLSQCFFVALHFVFLLYLLCIHYLLALLVLYRAAETQFEEMEYFGVTNLVEHPAQISAPGNFLNTSHDKSRIGILAQIKCNCIGCQYKYTTEHR